MSKLIETKICFRCKLGKSIEEFYVDKQSKCGQSSYCKECQIEYKKKKWGDDPNGVKRKEYLTTEKKNNTLELKTCSKCKSIKSFNHFYKSKLTETGFSCWCKDCDVIRKTYGQGKLNAKKSTLKYNSRHPEIIMLKGARQRAIKMNLSYSINLDDIVIPEKCPVLDIPLFEAQKFMVKGIKMLHRWTESIILKAIPKIILLLCPIE